VSMVTSRMTGVFRSDARTRAEFLRFIDMTGPRALARKLVSPLAAGAVGVVRQSGAAQHAPPPLVGRRRRPCRPARAASNATKLLYPARPGRA
jgi:hypothetical protein